MGREMEKLLKIPISNYNDVLTVLALPNFAPLLNMFDFEGRRAISVFVVENAVENETKVASAEQVDQILTLTSTLVADQVRLCVTSDIQGDTSGRTKPPVDNVEIKTKVAF